VLVLFHCISESRRTGIALRNECGAGGMDKRLCNVRIASFLLHARLCPCGVVQVPFGQYSAIVGWKVTPNTSVLCVARYMARDVLRVCIFCVRNSSCLSLNCFNSSIFHDGSCFLKSMEMRRERNSKDLGGYMWYFSKFPFPLV